MNIHGIKDGIKDMISFVSIIVITLSIMLGPVIIAELFSQLLMEI